VFSDAYVFDFGQTDVGHRAGYGFTLGIQQRLEWHDVDVCFVSGHGAKYYTAKIRRQDLKLEL
jgi:hypothetical protein